MDPLNNNPGEEGGLNRNDRGIVRQRQIPGEIIGNGDRWQNVNGFREYMEVGRGLMGRHLRNQSLLGIIKAIILLLFFMVLCFIFGYDWIPRMIALLFMVAAGLRYCWLRLHGQNINGININIQ
ncbi:unnamed protein product [Orchesella dallaii]|uniref:Uncharacterized protein n=1 Tax=Orchesella dallaii TaxID=48710 RepID=A0ABP1RGM5_9HEXA